MSLGKLFASFAAGGDGPVLRPTQIPEKEVIELSEKAATSTRNNLRNLFSVFPSEQLWELIGLQLQEGGNFDDEALGEAIQEGDRYETMRLMSRGLMYAFYVLYQNPRSALHRMQLVDILPDLAAADLQRLAAQFDQPEPEPLLATVPVAPVPPIDPIDQVVDDWKNLGSPAFKAKYMSNQRNRPLYDRAVREGRL